MNKWLVLLGVTGATVAVFGAIIAVVWWLARRYERAQGIGPDDGGRLSGESPIDHVASDQMHHD